MDNNKRRKERRASLQKFDIKYRDATPDDIPFLVDCVIRSLSSRTGRVVYQQLFDLSEEQFKEMMLKALANDMDHHDFSYKSYQIAEHNGKPVGGLSSWIEGAEGYSSKDIKANILKDLIGIDKWIEKLPLLQEVSKYDIPREFGTLQFEYAYLQFRYWGRNIMQEFFYYSFQKHKKLHPELKKAQAQIYRGNSTIFQVLQSLGFEYVREVIFSEKLLEVYPTDGMVLLESYDHPHPSEFD